MLTKEHFELIAKIIRELPLLGLERASVAHCFADEIQASGENVKFDRGRFITACLAEEE